MAENLEGQNIEAVAGNSGDGEADSILAESYPDSTEAPLVERGTEALEAESDGRAGVHEKVLEEIVGDKERLNEDVEGLKAQIAEMKAQMSAMQEELDSLRAPKELAEIQPRSIRNLDPSNPNSPIERLVNYADGTSGWVAMNKTAEATVTSDSTESAPVEPQGTEEVAVSAEEPISEDILEAAAVAPQEAAESKAAEDAIAPKAVEVPVEKTAETAAETDEANETGETDEANEAKVSEDEQLAEVSEDADKKPGKELVVYDGELPSDESEDAENESGKELVVHKGVEISPELQTVLQEALERYAEETAKSRNGYVGQFLRTSKFLVKIPLIGGLMQKFAEKANDFVDKDLDSARKIYEQSVRSAQLEVQAELQRRNKENPELSREQLVQAIQYNAGLLAVDADKAFEERVVAERTARSKPTTKIVNWWVGHQGIKSKLVKFAGVATVGAVAGGLATTIGAIIGGTVLPGVGAVAGAAAGAYVGNYINKRRANAVDAEGVTLAQRQSQEDMTKKEQVFTEAMGRRTLAKNPDYDPNNPDAAPEFVPNRAAMVRSSDLTSVTEGRTAEEMRGNRRRMAQAKAAGGIGGGLGEILTRGILSSADAPARAQAMGRPGDSPQIDSPSNPMNNGVTSESGVEQLPLTETQPTPEQLNGLDFNIEAGNGYTNELMDFASSNGHSLTPEQAWELHNSLVEQFGGDYIDIVNKAQDVYQTTGGDFRLTAPGEATWNPGVAEAVQTWMTGKGLW